MFDSLRTRSVPNKLSDEMFEHAAHYQSASVMQATESSAKSSREIVLQQLLQITISEDLSYQESMFLYIIFGIVFHSWLVILYYSEGVTRVAFATQALDVQARAANGAIQSVSEIPIYLRQQLDMLTEAREIPERGYISRPFSQRNEECRPDILTSLKTGFSSLASNTKDLIARYESMLGIYASLLAIEESNPAIQQAKNIG